MASSLNVEENPSNEDSHEEDVSGIWDVFGCNSKEITSKRYALFKFQY